jgi:hypothetical protein
MKDHGARILRRPEDEMESILQEGFDWRRIRDYFPFDDSWLSEGEYRRLLDTALKAITNPDDREALLDMLDLQYSVFLEQVALQDRILVRIAGEKAEAEEALGAASARRSRYHSIEDDVESAAFGERVMTYLQINSGYRRGTQMRRRSARSALLETLPGTLIDRLLGRDDESERDDGEDSSDA